MGLLLTKLLALLASYDMAAKGAITFQSWNNRRLKLIRELKAIIEKGGKPQ